ncbi:MAG: hypothetical protein PVJ21_02780 [Anaerolineales bacterium]|jgi:hypothetical protein
MSKKRGKHIFGMTGAQLAVLAILSLTAIGIIYGGFIFISSSTQPGDLSLVPQQPESQSARSVSGEVTPDLTDITSLSLTATLDPNQVQIPPDWKQYSNSRIELRVPPQFNSLNVDAQRQERTDFFKAQGAGFQATQLENDIFEYRYWFNFSQPDTVTLVTSVVVKAEFLPTETLAKYVDQAYEDDLQGYELLGRETYPIQGLEAERLLMFANLNGITVGIAEYVVTDEVNLWVISCWADYDEFSAWLPEFDRIARSFRLLY